MSKIFRTCRVCVLVFLTAFCLMSGIKAQAATANEKTAFAFFTDTMGLSPAAACGVMSNIKCESGFSPTISGMGGAYGICQWTGLRKSRLQSWCAGKGYSASSLKGQLHYLQYELKTYFPRVNNYLKSVSNTSAGAYNAAFYFCYYFEAPFNTYSTSVYRGKQAQSTYWKSLGASSTYVTAEVAGNGIRLNWNGRSENTYQVNRADSSGGSYTVIATIAAGAKSTYTDKNAAVGKKYYYYIQPVSSGGKLLGKSNKVSCSAKPSLEDEACSIVLSKTEYIYSGKACRPAVKVTYNGSVLKSGTHYTVSYSNNKNAGTATLRVVGKGRYCGSQKLDYTIQKANQNLKVSPIHAVMKTGLVSVKASAKGKITLRSEDCSVAVIKKGKLSLKKPGITRITVTASATKNYNAVSKSIVLTVTPARPVISGGSSFASGKAVLKWRKENGLDGYQIQYTAASKFSSGVSSVTVSGDTASCIFEGLPGGKTCRFRIRSYIILNNKKVYSQWSKIKTVKLKK